jgi:hypothetical protein
MNNATKRTEMLKFKLGPFGSSGSLRKMNVTSQLLKWEKWSKEI